MYRLAFYKIDGDTPVPFRQLELGQLKSLTGVGVSLSKNGKGVLTFKLDASDPLVASLFSASAGPFLVAFEVFEANTWSEVARFPSGSITEDEQGGARPVTVTLSSQDAVLYGVPLLPSVGAHAEVSGGRYFFNDVPAAVVAAFYPSVLTESTPAAATVSVPVTASLGHLLDAYEDQGLLSRFWVGDQLYVREAQATSSDSKLVLLRGSGVKILKQTSTKATDSTDQIALFYYDSTGELQSVTAEPFDPSVRYRRVTAPGSVTDEPAAISMLTALTTGTVAPLTSVAVTMQATPTHTPFATYKLGAFYRLPTAAGLVTLPLNRVDLQLAGDEWIANLAFGRTALSVTQTLEKAISNS